MKTLLVLAAVAWGQDCVRWETRSVPYTAIEPNILGIVLRQPAFLMQSVTRYRDERVCVEREPARRLAPQIACQEFFPPLKTKRGVLLSRCGLANFYADGDGARVEISTEATSEVYHLSFDSGFSGIMADSSSLSLQIGYRKHHQANYPSWPAWLVKATKAAERIPPYRDDLLAGFTALLLAALVLRWREAQLKTERA